MLLGSFSKVMAPGLRLGWLRAPAELRRACAVAKQAADLHTPTVNQLAAARYLADRDLDAHVTRVAAAYGARRDAMLAGLADALPAGSAWTRPEGGMFVWARLPEGYDTTALLPEVVRHRVAYVPAPPSTPASPTGPRCGCASSRRRRTRSRRGCGGWGRAAGRVGPVVGPGAQVQEPRTRGVPARTVKPCLRPYGRRRPSTWTRTSAGSAGTGNGGRTPAPSAASTSPI